VSTSPVNNDYFKHCQSLGKTISAVSPRQIVIVKQDPTAVVLRRRAELLRNIDYMETQIGRLAKMARDVRAEVLLLTTE
jgi:adenylate kinase